VLFPGAVLSQDRMNGPAIEGNVDRIEGFGFSITFGESVDRQHRIHAVLFTFGQ
jgi:hypothetical protein